ncbi:hypothetical protein CRG98_039905, partial [Punica granatum]
MGEQEDVRRAGRACWCASGLAGVCAAGERARERAAVRGYYSPESMVFARNEEIN